MEKFTGKYPITDYLYPSIVTQEDSLKRHSHSIDGTYVVRLTSFLRKKHTDGKWYLVPFIKNHSLIFHDDAHLQIVKQDKSRLLTQLHREIYRFTVAGILDPELKLENLDIWGNGKWLKLDEDQREESERMQNIF